MSFYKNFPLGINQIRLLTVSAPDPQNDAIYCTLEVVDLTDDVEYDALSYTWGAPAQYGKFKTMTSALDHPIICEGEMLWVAENLESFLKRARKTPSLAGKKFWIDAICINQQDTTERASQVKLMGRVYSSAKVVVMWMGEEDEYTGTAFSALQRISELVATHSLSESPAYLHRGGSHDLMLGVSDREAWASIGKFFQRCYFSRSWIIQEGILANKAVVLCGGQHINWEILVVASRFFSQTGWKTFLDNLSMDHPEERESPLPSYSHVPVILNAIRQDLPLRHWTTTLLYALQRSRDFKSTDLRDKVFCLLGLVEPFIGDKPRLTPAYGPRTVQTTYINTAIQLLEDGEDLYLLSCIEGELFQRVPNLPSWVPDWTCGKSTGLLIIGYKRYSASGALTQRPQIDASALTVSLKGVKVDHVTVAGEAKHQVLDGQPFSRWLEIVTSLPKWYRDTPEEAGGESRIEVFWRTLLRNTTGRPPKLIPPGKSSIDDAFRKWIRDKVMDKSRIREDPSWEEMGRSVLELLELDNLDTTPDEENHHSAPDDIEFETRMSWAKHLRLFRTSTGYLGLGSECLREGDSVWIMPSSRVPLILRSAGEDKPGHYRIVGGSYLHGVMQGQMVCPCCSGKTEEDIASQWETVIIE
ncbi:hypothetical protein ASPWEDRAFT_37642 [Aspergillus wentii DTO 134E9]|uniref:Heterokaryon incompatibility domain-containing protein n=1 Tax=Aspergillus wentii DTO 134E9 TaxID=1073089 RepID=A0A1L9RY03_ASPWE|nr:uncharacterized protein ASPWEDRAFT_37642 [Aspergillus wentii DTO 134E9]KAI9931539.1 hypothetical protein MW887_010116 [Aspergillus wentii]OJJ39792.1 hypothetical protein ASPWEDRAFT_37642 [Aspergillus wentii DTO 134E9]